jgi:hypothetical protein
MADRKSVEFRGSSLDDLRAFPDSARHEDGDLTKELGK